MADKRRSWMKDVPAASVSPFVFGFNAEVVMNDNDARERAVEECVRQLFTNGFGDKADRLVLAKTCEPSGFRDLGGRSKASVSSILRGVFGQGYDAAQARNRELEAEVERLKWIPIRSEADLPVKEGTYLGTFEDADGCGVIPVYLSHFPDGSRKFVTNDAYFADPGVIVAWMPLPDPEPFRG